METLEKKMSQLNEDNVSSSPKEQTKLQPESTEKSTNVSTDKVDPVSIALNTSSASPTLMSTNVYFPISDLQRLDEMLNRTRWVVPVLPKNELETLLDASIALCRQGMDTKSEHCQRFFRDGLMMSFVKILTDEAVNTWKYDIYKHIYNNTLKAVELCTLKLLDDWFPLLELLSMIFNPQCKYHISNSMRPPEMIIKVNINKTLLQIQDKVANKKNSINKSKLKSIKKTVDLPTKLESIGGGKEIELDYLNRNETNNEIQPNLTQTQITVNKTDDQFDEVSVSENEEFQANEINVKIGDNEDDDEDLQNRLNLLHRSPELTSAQETGEDRVELDADEDVDDHEEEDDEDEEAEDEEDADGEDDEDDDDEEEVDILKDYGDNNIINKNENDKILNKIENDLICLNKIQTDLKRTHLDHNNEESLKNSHLIADAESIKLERKLEFEQKHPQKNKKVKQKQLKVSKKCQNEEKNINSTEGVSNEDKNVTNVKNQATTIAATVTYARSHMKAPYGWLIDFINYFGQLNGFKLLLERFTNNVKLNIQVIAALLKPWGLCYEFLTSYTVKTFFLPIIEIVPKFFENLTDEDIKKECKSESKNDSISTVIKWLKLLATRVQNQEELCKSLEILRLKTILRILKFASFNGKMNALNEVNKVISNITYNIQMRTSSSISGSSSSSSTRNDNNDEEWLTCDRMAKWIQENDVLDIVLRDCMHQPQYVEKLEKILRFLIKEKALTLKDLDKIWESQMGKHEAIEKNVHDLLSKLAWDFTPEQLDHLFSCFQKSWTNASKKQREKLLDLIRSLSEDDKEGVMANKVLDLLWNLAHSDDAPTEIIDQAVAAHIKILDYSCSSDKESQKLKCLEKCIEQLKENKWVIVSMRQIKEILQQYPEMIAGSFQTNRLINYSQPKIGGSGCGTLNSSLLNQTTQYSPNSSQTFNLNNTPTTSVCCFYRPDIISKLQKEYSLISMITTNLADYYESIRKQVKEGNETIDPEIILPDGRFNHVTQIQERLNFMKYLLKEGQLWLVSSQAETIWKCLAQNSVFECDREICFKWFSKLMTDDPDLEPDMNKTFFVDYITKLDPKLLTDSGIRCFERFFKNVNLKYQRLIQKRHFFLTESLDLIGLDYLWKIVTSANEEIVEKAILLLKDIYIHLGPQLKSEQSAIHADLISNCMDRLRVSHDNLTILNKYCKNSTLNNEINQEADKENDDKKDEQLSNKEITLILRVMIVLREYLNEFDANYLYERFYPPLIRASKGKSIIIIVRFQVQNRQNEDIELLSHTNETVGSLRRQIFIKAKVNPQINKIDLIINNECVECVDDNKILAEYQLKEKMFIIARVSQTGSGLGISGSSGNNINSNTNNLNSGIHASNSRLDSSNDSSSDECGSGNEESHNVINSPNIEFEMMLPSVILSLNEKYVQFLIDLADFGSKINNIHIKECTRGILDLLPIAKHSAEKIKQYCKDCISNQSTLNLENLYFACTPTQCWYFLKVTHALLIPAVIFSHQDETKQFQENIIQAGGVTCFKNMLVSESFLANADDNTKKAALLYVLKLNKLTMTTVCYAIYSYVVNALTTKQFSQVSEALHNHAILLQNSTPSIPSGANEITLRNLAQRLGSQYSAFLLNNLPILSHITKLERIAWSLAATGSLNLVSSTYEQIHDALMTNRLNDSLMENNDDVSVCREALECLSLSLCLVPNALEVLNQEKHWRIFIVDMVLMCSHRVIRQTAGEQFLLIALKCSQQINRPLQFFIQMLFTCLHSLNKENAQQSQEYFFLLCRLLNCANVNNVQISNTETLLNNEIQWLKKVKQITIGSQFSTPNTTPSSTLASPVSTINNSSKSQTPISDEIIDEMLLDGHLGITKELLLFQNAEKKHLIGCQPQGAQLINDFVEYFIFPASYLFKKYRDSLMLASSGQNSTTLINNFEQLLANKSLKSICNSSMTTVSAFDLLISLCTGCLTNFHSLADLLLQLFYPSLLNSSTPISLLSSSSSTLNTSRLSETNSLVSSLHNQLTNDCTIAQNEWEYMPPIGQRPHNGFVGLKNAGATCYMNSVLQQLFMIKTIRNFILSVDTPPLNLMNNANGSCGGIATSGEITQSTSVFEDLDDADALISDKSRSDLDVDTSGNLNKPMSEEDQRKEYNMSIFKNLQMIFGHLAESKMQYYVPKGFWRQFRFGGGERVNLREQHDAVEFFNSVVDCIDESMKSLGKEQICSKILGGTFADQKICKGCPHKYSREESFTLLSVDVKHSQRLTESLEQYVKGDLLEGPNAYHCEKCNKKIDAVKRTCIKKLPRVLAIQLKRFDYDWEREIAVKSNEYFEFSRELDMEPYTVKGVAQIEKQQEILKQQQDLKLKQQQLLQPSNEVSLTSQKDSSVIESLPAEIEKPNELDLTKNSETNNTDDEEEEEDDTSKDSIYTNKYKLVGIVVHSGQANGGHYYSFIQNKTSSCDEDDRDDLSSTTNNNFDNSNSNSENNWYKFDDGDVSEFKMDDDELRNQCFGGDYTGEVYDNIMKRMAYKKQKRWWNAYILFYERLTKNEFQQQQLQQSNTSASGDTSLLSAASIGSLFFNKQRNQSGDSNSTLGRRTCRTNSNAFQLEDPSKPIKIPSFILKSVHKKNIKFLHHRHHFSVEYFQFMKKLCQANLYLCQSENPLSDDAENLCLASVQLAIKFLFGVGFRVKKTLRGPVNDWYEILSSYAKYSLKARQWMVKYFLIENPIVVPQYFLDCPSNEIRSTISKLLVTMVHLSINDASLEININEYVNSQPSVTVLVAATLQTQTENLKIRLVNASDSIIQTVLSIISKRDLINEQSSKYLVQYFQFFNMYSSIGIQQCFHLIRSDVPLTLMQFALDDLSTTCSNINLSTNSSSQLSGSSSFSLNYVKIQNNIQNQNGNISSQYADLNKLYCVVSTLLRCYDLSAYCTSYQSNSTVQPNPYSHYNELKQYHQQQQQQQQQTANTQAEILFQNSATISIKIPSKIEEYLFKQSKYIKKLLEDSPNSEDTIKLMKFLCWENMNFSIILLNELLWMITYHYSYELKPHLEMLYSILNISDSWQTNRLSFAFQGIPTTKKDGLFEIISNSQNNYQKRGYQIIKMLVQLFTTSELAIDLLNKDEELKKKWKSSRSWFYNEMEKCRIYNMPNYTYFQSPQSNETSQTYYLERTQSARITLEKAMKIFPPNVNSANANSTAASSSSAANNVGLNNIESNMNEEQVENDEEDAYESISDDENLDYRMKSTKISKENDTNGNKNIAS